MYYVIGWGTWGAIGNGMCIDGSMAKLAGPFKKRKVAWAYVAKIMKGCGFCAGGMPMVLKLNSVEFPRALLRKIDDNMFVDQTKYTDKDMKNFIRPIDRYGHKCYNSYCKHGIIHMSNRKRAKLSKMEIVDGKQ